MSKKAFLLLFNFYSPNTIKSPPITATHLFNFNCRSKLYVTGTSQLPKSAGTNLSQKMGTFWKKRNEKYVKCQIRMGIMKCLLKRVLRRVGKI